MKFTTIILTFALLIFLSGCDSRKDEKKISELERKTEELQRALQAANDPATIDAIQKQLREAATQKLVEMQKQRDALIVEIEKTTDQDSCDKLKTQIEKLDADMEKHIVDNAILQYIGRKYVSCTASGYNDDKGSDSSPKYSPGSAGGINPHWNPE